MLWTSTYNVLKEVPQFHSRQLFILQDRSVFLISVQSFLLHETRKSQLLYQVQPILKTIRVFYFPRHLSSVCCLTFWGERIKDYPLDICRVTVGILLKRRTFALCCVGYEFGTELDYKLGEKWQILSRQLCENTWQPLISSVTQW